MAPQPQASHNTANVREAERERLFAAFVGPNWQRHYRGSLTSTRVARWNWAAALVPCWLVWRRFWALQVAVVVVSFIAVFAVVALRSQDAPIAVLLLYALLGIAEGASADAMVHRRAAHALARVRASDVTLQTALDEMERAGGVSAVGVVLIPTMVVVVLLLAIPQFGKLHPWGQNASADMRADLRNLVSVEESYFAGHGTYTATPQDTGRGGTLAWIGPGITITMGPVSHTGWSATATRRGMNGLVCGIHVGSEAPPRFRGVGEGEARCWMPWYRRLPWR